MVNSKMNNPDMQRIFRCSEAELSDLKKAFKAQMQQTYVNGRPIIDQQASLVDEDRSLRNEMWQAVAEERDMFHAMLSGTRWSDGRPPNYGRLLQEAKTKIFRDLNCEARRRRGTKGNGKKASTSVSNSTASTTSTSSPVSTIVRSPSGNVGKRRSERLRGKTKGKPYPVRLAPAASPVDRMEGPGPRDEHAEDSNSVYSLGSHPRSKTVLTPINNIMGTGNSIASGGPSTDGPRDMRDTSSTSEIRVSSANRQLSDPFRSSSEPTSPWWNPDTPTRAERLHIRLDRAERWMPHQDASQPAHVRLTLSDRIQQAVDRGMADLETRVASLEEGTALFRELAQQGRELEARIIGNVEVMLADRDVEIERLRMELDAEKLWRTT